jgi:hypothetical protein
MMNIREGMKVMVTLHMSNKGRVTKVYYVPVQHGSAGGTFSKQMRVKFISEIKEYGEQDFRASDLTVLRDEG